MDIKATIGYSSGLCCRHNNGNIENIQVYGKIINGIASAGTNAIASICNTNSGNITRSINHAQLIGTSNNQGRIGGLCVYNSGNIEKSINYGEISLGYYQGGIVSSNQENGTIKECINYGNLPSNNDYKGGISGSNSGKIEFCYNKGNVLGRNCVGKITGQLNQTGNISNSYYLNKKNDNTIEGKIYNNSGTLVNYTQEEMKSEEVITILNEGNQNSIYKKDLNNINEGYPVFEWQ